MDLTLHMVFQEINTSFMFSVQVFISTVAIGPRVLSRCDSTTVAIALRFGFAFGSRMSLTKNIVSSRSSIHSQFFADTGTTGVSHHQSSGANHISANSHFTLSGFDSFLSILFIATMIETQASLA